MCLCCVFASCFSLSPPPHHHPPQSSSTAPRRRQCGHPHHAVARQRTHRLGGGGGGRDVLCVGDCPSFLPAPPPPTAWRWAPPWRPRPPPAPPWRRTSQTEATGVGRWGGGRRKPRPQRGSTRFFFSRGSPTPLHPPPALHPHRLPARPPQRGHMPPRGQPHRGFAPDTGDERVRGLRDCPRVRPAHTLHAVVAVGVVAAQKGVVPRPGRDGDVEVGVGGAQGGQVGLEEGAGLGEEGWGWSRPSN